MITDLLILYKSNAQNPAILWCHQRQKEYWNVISKHQAFEHSFVFLAVSVLCQHKYFPNSSILSMVLFLTSPPSKRWCRREPGAMKYPILVMWAMRFSILSRFVERSGEGIRWSFLQWFCGYTCLELFFLYDCLVLQRCLNYDFLWLQR